MPISENYRPMLAFSKIAEGLADVVKPAVFPKRILRYRNQTWALRVGLGELSETEWAAHFAHFEPLPGNLGMPLALRYHGHQFDVYNPALGDGRGFLFAQLCDDEGRLLDLGTKGSGQTPYSRGGDGRLTLKGGVREVLATSMLEALGVYTSKSFSLFETGESLFRGDEPSPTRSSVLVRLSHSHVRIGTFQRLQYIGDDKGLRRIFDYCIERFYPELSSAPNVPAAFLREVTRRSARLCASWLVAGFVHGVLNSDNMTVTGESFDYGPYRFLAHYDPAFVAAYFDQVGLYAFGRQPRAVLRNLVRLGQALAPLCEEGPLAEALQTFSIELENARVEFLLARLGIRGAGHDEDHRLAALCWDFLATTRMPYDRLFFDWYAGPQSEARAKASPFAHLYESSQFAELRSDFLQRAPSAPEKLELPYFQRAAPCSLLIDEIEELWAAIAERDDWSLFTDKLAQISELSALRNAAPSAD